MTSLALSADKKEILAGTSLSKIYRLLSSDLSYMVHTDAHFAPINAVAFGGAADQFVTIDESGIVKLWDGGEYKTIFTASGGNDSSGSSCCIADDGSIITGWRDGSIKAFDPVSQSVLWELSGAHRGSVTSLYVNENYVLSGGQEGAVRIWARLNRKMLIQFNDHFKDVVSLFPDVRDAHIIHSASMDRSICTYDLKQEVKINGHQTKNGSLFALGQRKDNELELGTSH